MISAKGRELDSIKGAKTTRPHPVRASINPATPAEPSGQRLTAQFRINVAIASPTGSSIGIGFAVPSRPSKVGDERLIACGKVARGCLGIATSARQLRLSGRLKSYYGVEGGALIAKSCQYAAKRGGLKNEDVITSFDGRPVNNYGDLRKRAATPPGKQVEGQIVPAPAGPSRSI